MMRILAGIVGAFKRAFAFLGRCAAAPFAALAGLVGGGSDLEFDIPDEPVDDDEDRAVNAAKIAAAVTEWACVSAMVGDQAPIPSALPDDVRAWLPGLSADETAKLAFSDERAVKAHLAGLFFIDGVPRVRPLKPADWHEKPVDAFSTGPSVTVPAREGRGEASEFSEPTLPGPAHR